VQYLIIRVEEVGAIASVAPALAKLVERAVVRIFDLAIVDKGSMVGRGARARGVRRGASLPSVHGETEGLLSCYDFELVATASPPGTAAIAVVAEDRWAESLAWPPGLDTLWEAELCQGAVPTEAPTRPVGLPSRSGEPGIAGLC
jgi:hypothetical protein